MKKIILAVLLIAGVSSTSCKKSYNCTCYDLNGNPTSTTVKAYTVSGAAVSCAGKGSDCSI